MLSGDLLGVLSEQLCGMKEAGSDRTMPPWELRWHFGLIPTEAKNKRGLPDPTFINLLALFEGWCHSSNSASVSVAGSLDIWQQVW